MEFFERSLEPEDRVEWPRLCYQVPEAAREILDSSDLWSLTKEQVSTLEKVRQARRALVQYTFTLLEAVREKRGLIVPQREPPPHLESKGKGKEVTGKAKAKSKGTAGIVGNGKE